MRIRNTLQFVLLAAIVATTLLILRSSSTKPHSDSKEPRQECCRNGDKCKGDENDELWENFSRHLISVSALPVSIYIP